MLTGCEALESSTFTCRRLGAPAVCELSAAGQAQRRHAPVPCSHSSRRRASRSGSLLVLGEAGECWIIEGNLLQRRHSRKHHIPETSPQSSRRTHPRIVTVHCGNLAVWTVHTHKQLRRQLSKRQHDLNTAPLPGLAIRIIGLWTTILQQLSTT